MKKTVTLFAFLLYTTVVVFAGKIFTKDVIHLPQTAQTFISTYFGDLKIQKIEIEDEIFESKTFEVDFTNGYEVKFDKNGEWYKVDCKRDAVPSAIVLEDIMNYVKENFEQDYITEIEKERNGFEVELQSDITIKFNKQGEFKKYD
ncbi:hypothetical protein Bcop_1968 [Bacteroides coprosuis DSM 18011]|uniref:Putative beta-lactamase-inhibitor-like PepSY-like domain-containing protein n=2 Tax=Bacteroides TaxID=816 RepID=F3ZSJ2_9BACE|nr:PepSY-like domain-containing protein [Bacteroides coprosuis]EGJ72144.1 hypothetical protein Bcop_1968 [Bacteroides coprosuis DSM 18011]HJD92042.1 PepSY-like domain-containing protein [Bacteroides coprosuis]